MSLKHVSGWLNVTGAGFDGPADPDYGHPVGPGWNPVDPGYGRPGGGTDPGYGHPAWGGRPDNDLPSGGHIWGTLIRWLSRPQVGGGPIKPPGLWPIAPGPIDPGWGQGPVGPPHGPGDWVPVDPGFGKPPIWGFLPVDPGFGVGGSGNVPDNSLPGHWVPLDPGFGKPVGSCGDRPPHIWGKPRWVWIAEIGPDFGMPLPGTPEPK